MINQFPTLIYNHLALNYLCKVQWFLCFLTLLDFLNIYCYVLITASQIVVGYEGYDETKNSWYYLSIYYLYKEYLPTNKYLFNIVAIVITSIFTVLFFCSFLILKSTFIEIKGKIKQILIKIYINFFELFNFFFYIFICIYIFIVKYVKFVFL